MGDSEMLGAEDRAALSARIGDLAGTVCDCVRAVPPGWHDAAFPDREAPAGRRYVQGVDGETLPDTTAKAGCERCDGTGRIHSDDYPGRCACAQRLPAGWLMRPVPAGSRWPDPPSGRIYRIDPKDPQAPPRWSALPACVVCGGTGSTADLVPPGEPDVRLPPGLVPAGSTSNGDLDSGVEVSELAGRPARSASRDPHVPITSLRHLHVGPIGPMPAWSILPIDVAAAARDALLAVRCWPRETAVRALQVAAQLARRRDRDGGGVVRDYDPFGLLTPDLFWPVPDPGAANVYPSRVISGGQTGADTGGLIAAARNAIPTGGTAPQGWLRERSKGGEGEGEQFMQAWGLEECSDSGYPARNLCNIRAADLTIIFVRGEWTSGSRLTRKQLLETSSRWLEVNLGDIEPGEEMLRVAWELWRQQIGTLNVAGTRETRAPGITRQVDGFLDGVFRLVRHARRLGDRVDGKR